MDRICCIILLYAHTHNYIMLHWFQLVQPLELWRSPAPSAPASSSSPCSGLSLSSLPSPCHVSRAVSPTPVWALSSWSSSSRSFSGSSREVPTPTSRSTSSTIRCTSVGPPSSRSAAACCWSRWACSPWITCLNRSTRRVY